MTEAAIAGGLTPDLYVALGEKPEENSRALQLILQAIYPAKIWIGGLFIALGGLFSMFDQSAIGLMCC